MTQQDKGLTAGNGEALDGMLSGKSERPQNTTPAHLSQESSGFSDFVLRGLRVAHVRTRILLNEIEFAGTALKRGLISPDHALNHLHDAGGFGLFPSLTEASS